MAFYGSQTQTQQNGMKLPIPMQATQHPFPRQFPQNITQQLPMVHQTSRGNGVNVTGADSHQQNGVIRGGDKTLELKVISSSLKPTALPGCTQDLQQDQTNIYANLPKSDCELLSLVECFAFKYRRRQSYEPEIMQNASVYHSKLTAAKSSLLDCLGEVVGLRCSACRQASLLPQSYQSGSAQLISIEFFEAKRLKKPFQDLNKHILTCPYVMPDIKASLQRTSVMEGNYALENYLSVWVSSVRAFARASGYPMLTPGQPQPYKRLAQAKGATMVGTATNGQPFSQREEDPGVAALFEAVKAARGSNFSLQQQVNAALHGDMLEFSFSPQDQPLQQPHQQTPLVSDAEEDLLQELEHSVQNATRISNYGLAKAKTTILASDLSLLPCAGISMVSPLLETLLQSHCVTLNWAAVGKKRKSDSMQGRSEHYLRPRVCFECRFCKNHSSPFCVTTGTPNGAAKFLIVSGLDHLIDECEKVDISIQGKLITLKKVTGIEETDMDAVAIEKHFPVWKEYVQRITAKTYHPANEGPCSTFWRPLTWSFIKKVGAAVIADQSLESKGRNLLPSQADASKKLPFAARDDDVVFGWNRPHVGNRRFIELMNKARPAVLGDSLTPIQEGVIAATIVKTIGTRGGRFYLLGSDYATTPPKLIPPHEAITKTRRVLTGGIIVLLQPPSDPTANGRGSRVLESEYAPQRDVFGTSIITNKRFKRVSQEEGNSE